MPPHTRHAIHVCTTCRRAPADPAVPPDGERMLAALAAAMEGWAHRDAVALAPVQCMNACARSCAVALAGEGKWSFLFADLDPETAAPALLACAETYIGRADGKMMRSARPEALRDTLLVRIPPLPSGR
ncbi:DUF1636 domain-containing protein [Azospirillum sp. RWY-5-1]|uniref:DUF1636 domain-containing protein n=1 Tax=Azospirillum oleiclasticum TaxID=2735135 RepID=A0ABX2T6P7_9PROT|nr:DUF1636 domain-containing protein [Azospirillum oleiclasticum]NYZ18893.1 DUF1636 domain-containing protein [Azospirillum oleiclasticum]